MLWRGKLPQMNNRVSKFDVVLTKRSHITTIESNQQRSLVAMHGYDLSTLRNANTPVEIF